MDLLLVEQEAARAARLVPKEGRRLVLGDVGALEEDLAFLRACVGFLEADLAVADGLDLAAGEGNAGLVAVENFVIVPGAAVNGDVPETGRLDFGRATLRCRRLCGDWPRHSSEERRVGHG